MRRVNVSRQAAGLANRAFQDYAEQTRRLADALIRLEGQIHQYGKGPFRLGGGLDLQPLSLTFGKDLPEVLLYRVVTEAAHDRLLMSSGPQWS